MIVIKVSKDRYINRWVVQEKTSRVDEIASKTIHKDRDREKRSKTPNKVKLVENK